MNQSYQEFSTGLIFFITFHSNILISTIDTINTKKDSENKHVKDIQIFLKKKKAKGEKKSEKDIKIFLNKKSTNYLTIWKNIILHIKSNYFGHFKNPKAIKFVSRINPWSVEKSNIFLWV